MTTPHLTCDEFGDRLPYLLERELSEADRAAMESHALACDDCGPLLADIRNLRLSAANLPELAPSRDLWAGIESRIETPVVQIGWTGGRVDRWTGGRQRQAWLIGVAAAGLVAVTAGVTYQLTRRAVAAPVTVAVTTPMPTPARPNTDTARTTTLPMPSQQVASAAITRPPVYPSTRPPETARPPETTRSPEAARQEVTATLASNTRSPGEATYDREISRLRRIVNGRRSELDSNTVAVVEKNLHIIDEAIAQCRSALRKDPGSHFLMESLDEALDSKVQLLRAAATMPIGS